MQLIHTVFGFTASFLDASQGVYVDLPTSSAWDGQAEDIFGVQAVLGSAFNDVINGTASNYVLDGGPSGADTINGAVGNILSYVTSNSGVYVDLTAGTSWDGQNHDTISGFHNVIGSAFNDTIFGTSGDDVINGGVGGADTLNGEGGHDTVSYSLSLSGVIIDLNSSLTWDGTNNDNINAFTDAIGSDYNDTFIGTAGVSNHFDGGAGSDTIMFPNVVQNTTSKFALSGVDVDLHDPQNESSFYATNGVSGEVIDHDTFSNIENAIGTTFQDYFISGPASNTFQGNNTSMPTGDRGAMVFTGAYSGDYVDYSHSSSGVIVDLSANASWDGQVNDFLFDISNVVGSQFNDTFYSDQFDNYFDGGHGSDTYVFTPGFNYDTIKSVQDGSDHIRLVGFGNITYQDLSVTASAHGGSDVHVVGDPNASDVINVLDVTPANLTADYFIFG